MPDTIKELSRSEKESLLRDKVLDLMLSAASGNTGSKEILEVLNASMSLF